MATNKRVFTLRLSDEVFDKIGVLATKEHRSITNYVALLAEGVDRNRSRAMSVNNSPGRPPRGGRG